MKRAVIIAAIALALSGGAARAWLGLGNHMNKLGAASGKGTAAPPPVSCPSTGVFDLSNVCNDIYFLGGLK